MRQLSFSKTSMNTPPSECGGSLNNTRKRPRTLSSKLPTHLILKTHKRFTLFRKRGEVKKILFKQARRFGIRIYSFSVQKDHIHLIIKILDRDSYNGFIRAFTGLLSRLFKGRIFKFRPYTRIAKWGRDFTNLKNYVFQNEMEIYGIWQHSQRGIALKNYVAATTDPDFWHKDSRVVSLL